MKISNRIELVSDGVVRMALVGPVASGKTSLARALMPSVEAVGTGSCESLSMADVVVYVHDLRQPVLSRSEVVDLETVAMTMNRRKGMNLVLAGTHRDCLSGGFGDEPLAPLATAVSRIVGYDVPGFGVSSAMWRLARCELESGREIAARCFRESSGVGPILDWLEGVRWHLQGGTVEFATQIANKVADVLSQRQHDVGATL